MNLLPQGSSRRPRTACEIAPDGVVAARSGELAGSLSAASRVLLPAGAVLPGLKPGNLADRVAVIAALRRSLEKVGARPNARGSEITLIVPDGATRVLLLDFDALPSKLSEALPIVRFRLKKMLPFEADEAMVSYQVMSSLRGQVRVLAVAIPRDVLAEYETALREAGYEPGAVLPSTLAALPGVPTDKPALLINGSRLGVTTAILRGEMLLLHRTVDLQTSPVAFPANLPPALFEGVALPADRPNDRQIAQPDPASGLNAYADRRSAEEAVQGSVASSRLTRVFDDTAQLATQATAPSSLGTSSILVTPSSLSDMIGSEAELAFLAASALDRPPGARTSSPAMQSVNVRPGEDAPDREVDEEIAQAVSVAMAYFEDTLSSVPTHLWSAGAMPAEALANLLRRQGLLDEMGIEVRELIDSSALEQSTIGASVPRSALAGVAGALRI